LKLLAAGTAQDTGEVRIESFQFFRADKFNYPFFSFQSGSDSFRIKNQSETFAGTPPGSVHIDRKVTTTISSPNHLDTKFTADEVYSSV
jgi:hypothetical protein